MVIKKHLPYKKGKWEQILLKEVGKQIDGYDCGVYVCLFAHLLHASGRVKYLDIPSSETMQLAMRLKILESLISHSITDLDDILGEVDVILSQYYEQVVTDQNGRE
jgi:Ulp1 family protease